MNIEKENIQKITKYEHDLKKAKKEIDLKTKN